MYNIKNLNLCVCVCVRGIGLLECRNKSGPFKYVESTVCSKARRHVAGFVDI